MTYCVVSLFLPSHHLLLYIVLVSDSNIINQFLHEESKVVLKLSENFEYQGKKLPMRKETEYPHGYSWGMQTHTCMACIHTKALTEKRTEIPQQSPPRESSLGSSSPLCWKESEGRKWSRYKLPMPMTESSEVKLLRNKIVVCLYQTITKAREGFRTLIRQCDLMK